MAIIVSIYLPGIAAGVLGNFGAVVFSGFVSGTITGGLQGGLEGAFGGALFYGIGSHFMKGAGAKGTGFLGSGLKAGRFAQKVLAHATAGGVLSVLEGGKFGHGFVSAGVAEAGASTIDGNLHSSFAKVAASAMVGGSVSYLAGGKFGNGAATGAMQMAFNHLHESGFEDSKTRIEGTVFFEEVDGYSPTTKQKSEFFESISAYYAGHDLEIDLTETSNKRTADLTVQWAGVEGRANVQWLPGFLGIGRDRVGSMKLFSNATRGVIIHEFGHVLGLDDEYSDVTHLGAGGMGPPHTYSVANLGFENNLMGNNSTRSEWDLSSQQLQRIRSKPVRNGFDYQ